MTEPISRRSLLVGAASTAAAALLGGRKAVHAMPAAPPAIDTHTHFYDPTRPQGIPWPPPGDSLLHRPHLPAEFRALSQAHGVVGTVVVEASPRVEDNQWVLDLAAEDPLVVGFVGNLRPGSPDFAAQLRRFSGNPLFRGIRLGGGALSKGLGEPAFEADLRRLAERDLALDLLGGEAMLRDVARLAETIPELRMVIDHLPFDAWDGDVAAARHALAPVAALPRVFGKVSNVVRRVNGRPVEDPGFYRAGLDTLWELFGADRLLFGSNWPVSNRVAPYAVVHRVVADYLTRREPGVAEKFFWGNSLAAYRWVPR